MANQYLPNQGAPFTAASVTKADGSQVQVMTSGFAVQDYDYVGVAYPTTSQEVYTFKTGGSGGTTVATITLNYSDPVTKAILTSAART